METIYIALAIILTHIIAFLTGYYLCFKNCRPKESILEHGIDPRIQPQPKVDELKDTEKP